MLRTKLQIKIRTGKTLSSKVERCCKAEVAGSNPAVSILLGTILLQTLPCKTLLPQVRCLVNIGMCTLWWQCYLPVRFWSHPLLEEDVALYGNLIL